jgi:hypothetical protein
MRLLESTIIKNGVVIKRKNKYDFIHITKDEATELLKAKLIYNYGKGFLAFRKCYKNAFDQFKQKLIQNRVLF